jgi:uncharacterized Tic20 family protein
MTLSVEQRNWALLAHFSASVCMFLLPSFGWLGPAFIWVVRRNDPEVRWHAGQAVAFQLGMTLAALAVSALGTALSCFLIGAALYVVALIPWFAGIVLPIVAGTRVSNGESRYRYPVTGDWVAAPAVI